MRTILIFTFFALQIIIHSQTHFDKWFESKTLRMDYARAGNDKSASIYFNEFIEEKFWGGSRVNLIDTFKYGSYIVELYDKETSQLLYSRTYSTLFHEWQTTNEAKITSRSFGESVVMPFPKRNSVIKLYERNFNHIPILQFEKEVNPNDYFIRKQQNVVFRNSKLLFNGDPAIKVDVVLIPEGYREVDSAKLKQDAEEFREHLLGSSPCRENRDKFNIWLINAYSKNSGTDIPADSLWRNTVANTSFYTFDVERYLMTSDYQAVRDLAANAPCDQIYILVNTDVYGGGAIYNFYSIATTNKEHQEYLITHEFGHGFAFLADEYYDSETAYNDFYSKDVEPLEPNITTLKDFGSKWQRLVDKTTPIPTPANEKYREKVGAFEGGGYVAKGVFRPKQDCTMKTISVDNFCPVCKSAIQLMIDFYTK